MDGITGSVEDEAVQVYILCGDDQLQRLDLGEREHHGRRQQ